MSEDKAWAYKAPLASFNESWEKIESGNCRKEVENRNLIVNGAILTHMPNLDEKLKAKLETVKVRMSSQSWALNLVSNLEKIIHEINADIPLADEDGYAPHDMDFWYFGLLLNGLDWGGYDVSSQKEQIADIHERGLLGKATYSDLRKIHPLTETGTLWFGLIDSIS